jgi:hypothetical protein
MKEYFLWREKKKRGGEAKKNRDSAGSGTGKIDYSISGRGIARSDLVQRGSKLTAGENNLRNITPIHSKEMR